MWEQLHGIFILRGCHWPLLTSQIHRWNTFGFVSCQRKILNIQEKAKLLHVCIWEGQTYFLFSRNKTAHWNSIPQARNGRAPILSLSGQYWPYCKILVLMKDDRCLRQKKKKDIEHVSLAGNWSHTVAIGTSANHHLIQKDKKVYVHH